MSGARTGSAMVVRRRVKARWIVLPLLVVALGALLAGHLPAALRRLGGAEPAARPATRPIRIEVLNGCGIPGAAERIATRLRAGRFLVERMGDAPEFGYTEDLVIARTSDREAMLEVAGWLGCPARLIQRNETSDVDVTVIVGRPPAKS